MGKFIEDRKRGTISREEWLAKESQNGIGPN